MYKVVFTQRAVKDLENIDEQMRNRIAVKLREYAKEPQRYARKLINPNHVNMMVRYLPYRIQKILNHKL